MRDADKHDHTCIILIDMMGLSHGNTLEKFLRISESNIMEASKLYFIASISTQIGDQVSHNL